eukprot:ANDGO_00370.mRNA.1 hypothetical protein
MCEVCQKRTTFVGAAFSLNVTMSKNDVFYGGTQVTGYPIWFGELVAACSCSMHVFFSFRHPIMQGNLRHSVGVDLQAFTGKILNTYTAYSGNSIPIFDFARIPGRFEAFYTHGAYSFATGFYAANVDKVSLLNVSAATRVFTFVPSLNPLGTDGCDFVDPYTGLASFRGFVTSGDFVVNVTSNAWFVPPSPLAYTCARASVPPSTTTMLYVNYIAGGQLDTTLYAVHNYTSSNGGKARRGLGVVLAERTPRLYAWASEETPTGFLYKALLSNANFTDSCSH